MLHTGGTTATAGTYWNVQNGSRVVMAGAGVLPGSGSDRYIKAPVLAVLLAGPVLGLIFAVFLPLIGIVMTMTAIVRKTAAVTADLAANSMSFGWRPIEAYLTGRKKKKEQSGGKEQQDTDGK